MAPYPDGSTSPHHGRMRQPNGRGVRHAALHEEAEAEVKGGVAWELGSKSRGNLIWSSGQVHGERSVFRLGDRRKIRQKLDNAQDERGTRCFGADSGEKLVEQLSARLDWAGMHTRDFKMC
jgi:hypothetical protein